MTPQRRRFWKEKKEKSETKAELYLDISRYWVKENSSSGDRDAWLFYLFFTSDEGGNGSGCSFDGGDEDGDDGKPQDKSVVIRDATTTTSWIFRSDQKKKNKKKKKKRSTLFSPKSRMRKKKGRRRKRRTKNERGFKLLRSPLVSPCVISQGNNWRQQDSTQMSVQQD